MEARGPPGTLIPGRFGPDRGSGGLNPLPLWRGRGRAGTLPPGPLKPPPGGASGTAASQRGAHAIPGRQKPPGGAAVSRGRNSG